MAAAAASRTVFQNTPLTGASTAWHAQNGLWQDPGRIVTEDLARLKRVRARRGLPDASGVRGQKDVPPPARSRRGETIPTFAPTLNWHGTLDRKYSQGTANVFGPALRTSHAGHTRLALENSELTNRHHWQSSSQTTPSPIRQDNSQQASLPPSPPTPEDGQTGKE